MDETAATGRPLALDPTAASADAELPAFLAPPANAPVYHGFPVIDGVEVDGWRLGMITDFLAMPTTIGDGYIIAPDGGRAGLVWTAEHDDVVVHQVLAPEPGRWGVWEVALPLPLTSVDEARAYLAALVPLLRPHWAAWRAAG
ncbi:MAG TPA: hypothetical protein VHW44_32480 [Pseudonocardiaceae bacterium]|jgi:hypothetical protein|nr:hypothetical protein [Pseudonocardiaceae bacterium]